MSQRHITNAKRGWEGPRKRIQAPETGDGALLLSSPTGANKAEQVSQCTIHAQRRTRLVFFFFPLSLSFSKEGCTRAFMGQLEHKPCALCHCNTRASGELVQLQRRGERSPFQAPLLTLYSCAGREQNTCQPGNAPTGTSKARLLSCSPL